MESRYLLQETKIGRYLPKKLGKLEISCADENLKEQLQKLFLFLHYKIIGEKEREDILDYDCICDWTEEDFKLFRTELGKMPVSIFQKVYPILFQFCSFSKIELEDKLRKIDSKLTLHLFDEERVMQSEKVFVRIAGKEQVQIQNTYHYQKHQFTVADMPKFFMTFFSTTRKSCEEGWKIYLGTDFEEKNISEKIEELKQILDCFYQKKDEMMYPIIANYEKWLEGLQNELFYPELLKLTDIFFPTICNILGYRLATYYQQLEKEHNCYKHEVMDAYFGKQAKEKKEKQGYRFG